MVMIKHLGNGIVHFAMTDFKVLHAYDTACKKRINMDSPNNYEIIDTGEITCKSCLKVIAKKREEHGDKYGYD